MTRVSWVMVADDVASLPSKRGTRCAYARPGKTYLQEGEENGSHEIRALPLCFGHPLFDWLFFVPEGLEPLLPDDRPFRRPIRLSEHPVGSEHCAAASRELPSVGARRAPVALRRDGDECARAHHVRRAPDEGRREHEIDDLFIERG